MANIIVSRTDNTPEARTFFELLDMGIINGVGFKFDITHMPLDGEATHQGTYIVLDVQGAVLKRV